MASNDLNQKINKEITRRIQILDSSEEEFVPKLNTQDAIAIAIVAVVCFLGIYLGM